MAFGLNKKAIIKFFILIVLLISLVVISFKLSPYPSAWIIRHTFDKEAERVNIALEKYVPKNITSKLDIIYNPNDSQNVSGICILVFDNRNFLGSEFKNDA